MTPIAKRIELWPVDRLKPYERNARTHSAEQIAKIAASITEFGFTNPILVDSADGIIAGHGRLEAAKLLGLDDVPVIVLDHLSDAQRRAYILADNRLALDAGWDEGMLAAELAAAELPGAADAEAMGLPPEIAQGYGSPVTITPQSREQLTMADLNDAQRKLVLDKFNEVFHGGGHEHVQGNNHLQRRRAPRDV